MPLKYLTRYAHLSGPQREVAEQVSRLAQFLSEFLPPGPETLVTLRKLLEARDAAVRASLDLNQAPQAQNEWSER